MGVGRNGHVVCYMYNTIVDDPGEAHLFGSSDVTSRNQPSCCTHPHTGRSGTLGLFSTHRPPIHGMKYLLVRELSR